MASSKITSVLCFIIDGSSSFEAAGNAIVCKVKGHQIFWFKKKATEIDDKGLEVGHTQGSCRALIRRSWTTLTDGADSRLHRITIAIQISNFTLQPFQFCAPFNNCRLSHKIAQGVSIWRLAATLKFFRRLVVYTNYLGHFSYVCWTWLQKY